MKSDYLERRKREIDCETESEIRTIEADITRQMPSGPSDPTPFWVGGAVAGILMWILLKSFWIGLGAFLLIGFAGKFITESNYRDTVSALRMSMRVRTDNARKNGQNRYEREKSEYTNAVGKARDYFGKRMKRNDTANVWLVKNFDNEIRIADRRPHVREVRAPFTFRVDEGQIEATTHRIVNNERRSETRKFDFTVNLYNHVPQFTDQVGLAHAFGRALKYDLSQKYPYDPSDPTRYPSRIEIKTNDNTVTMTYIAANGNYQHSKSF